MKGVSEAQDAAEHPSEVEPVHVSSLNLLFHFLYFHLFSHVFYLQSTRPPLLHTHTYMGHFIMLVFFL